MFFLLLKKKKNRVCFIFFRRRRRLSRFFFLPSVSPRNGSPVPLVQGRAPARYVSSRLFLVSTRVWSRTGAGSGRGGGGRREREKKNADEASSSKRINAPARFFVLFFFLTAPLSLFKSPSEPHTHRQKSARPSPAGSETSTRTASR